MQADAGSENVVYLVDASSSMLQTAGIKGVEVRDSEDRSPSTPRHQKEGLRKSIRSQGYLEEDTYMDLALKVIREILKQHVIGSPKDQMAVIFYNAVSPFQRLLVLILILIVTTAGCCIHAGCCIRNKHTQALRSRHSRSQPVVTHCSVKRRTAATSPTSISSMSWRGQQPSASRRWKCFKVNEPLHI